jgi:hypothetical protein
MPGSKSDISVDFNQGIEMNGQTFYPLSRPSEINPCAGKSDGASCGNGGVCKSGQCWYSLLRLKELGIKVPDR